MPSITYWNRIEPRPRTSKVTEALAAKVRDPMWLFTRQWQLGEFRGEDAGSAAFVQTATRVSQLDRWSVGSEKPKILDPAVPLEAAILNEGFNLSDFSISVELGQVFEEALERLGRGELVDKFRETYPLAPEFNKHDRDAQRFLEVVTRRGTDGLALHLASESAAPNLPDRPVLEANDLTAVKDALTHLRSWVQDTIGLLSSKDSIAWNPERLEYKMRLSGRDPDGGNLILSGHPDRGGRFEWFAFDVQERAAPPGGLPAKVKRVQRSSLPSNVTFSGMPRARWWAFESSVLNPEAIRPEKREIGKLVVLDFMLVHSNDWYLVPIRLDVGSVSSIESLVVVDVFGVATSVERADRLSRAAGQRWTMFSTAFEKTNSLGDFLYLPPTAGPTILKGESLETVKFVRDEMANMAWAIESVVENRIGEPWVGYQKALTAQSSTTSSDPSSETGSELKYRIQTSVPENWTPLVPVALDNTGRRIALQRAVLLQSGTELQPPGPVGRILNPTLFSKGQYQIAEEEISRLGVRVERIVNRARWTDGTTHLWISRLKNSGIGEEQSGLIFDSVMSDRK